MDKRLKQLVTEARRHASQSMERQQALTELVDEILRSRKICRPYRGQPLSGVYQEIYQQVRAQLLCDVSEAIDKLDMQSINVREWASQIRDEVLKNLLDDAQLKKLALAAKEHPPNTESRQHALIELVNAIVLSSRLCHPHRWISPDRFYQLIYDESVNKTLLYVCQKIDNYDPNRGNQRFINWVNYHLDRTVLTCYGKFIQQSQREIPSLDILESMAPTKPQSFIITEVVRECLEEDTNNFFKNEYIRNHPNANFQAIALATLAGKSWKEISDEFGIKIATLSNFFRRCCQKFAPVFQEYL